MLTGDMAKPAVPFGGKFRIIDFPLSNCANSGIDTVGVLTQYRPLELNNYIGSGQPWELDRKMCIRDSHNSTLFHPNIPAEDGTPDAALNVAAVVHQGVHAAALGIHIGCLLYTS